MRRAPVIADREALAVRPGHPLAGRPVTREEIFAYGDTPEDFAMLTLATTKIYRWDEAPP